MRTQQRVGGITMIGFLIMVIVIGFFAYIAMLLIPVYVEYFGVVKSLEQLHEDPGAGQKSLFELKRDLSLKFDVQYVDELPPDAITLRREKGATILNVHYERRKPFVYNVDLVATFDKSVNLSNSPAG